jgi:glycerol-3-phosphate dehydrogenase (NAD(P)+)
MESQAAGGNEKIAVLGAGSWGATLANLLARNGKDVCLWSHQSGKANALASARALEKPFKVQFPDNLLISGDLGECVSGARVVIFCCPAQAMREVSQNVSQNLKVKVTTGQAASSLPLKAGAVPVLVSAAKGVELHTFKRMTEVLQECIAGLPACSLSGPNLAREVLMSLPSAAVVACEQAETANYVQRLLSVPTFRLYTNSDVVGVELGGALKNVVAIAAGAVDGLALGGNAKAALITRGLAEMTRLAERFGARPTTLMGLSGVGDLVATCYSALSRNYSLGLAMAQGVSFHDAQERAGAVVEGVTTTYAVCELSEKLGIQMPIAEQVAATLRGETTPKGAIMTLMARPLSSE